MADTTFAAQIGNLATRVGTECKTLHTKVGELTQLGTTDKTSVVKAVNEVKTAATTLQGSLNELTSRVTAAEGTANTNKGELTTVKGQISTMQESLTGLQDSVDAIEGQIESQTNINDETPSNTTTYSSNKIESVVTAAKEAVKSDLLGGAGTAYDTLKELADLIQANGASITALQALAAGHVKFDEAQTLTDEQKTRARGNIGAASTSEVMSAQSTLQGEIDAAEQAATNALNTFKTAVGDTNTDFVAAFETALGASA